MVLFIIGILVGIMVMCVLYTLIHLVRSGTYNQGYQDALFDQHKVDMEKIRMAMLNLQVEPDEKEGNDSSETD